MKNTELTPLEETFLNATRVLVANGMEVKEAKKEVIKMMNFILDKIENK